MLLLRPCLYLIVLVAVASSALADEQRLSVVVTEAGTGKVLRGVACALVRAGEKRAYARFASPDYRGRVAVADGDTLLVYRRGCDMARIPLKKGQSGVEVALRPASRLCAIELAEAGKEDARLRLSWWIEPAGEWIGEEPIVDSFHEDVTVRECEGAVVLASHFVLEGRTVQGRASGRRGVASGIPHRPPGAR